MAPATVLVVDDSPLDRRLASRLAAKHPDLRAIDAGNGVEALELIAEQQPDIVLTDLLMPQMDGLSLVEAIRQQHSALPVVLMTAHGSEDTAAQALRRGAASYVPKRDLAAHLVPTLLGLLELTAPNRNQQLVLESLTQSASEFRIGNTARDIAALVYHLESNLGSLTRFDDTTRLQVGVALREALTNAAYHGNLDADSELRESPGGEWEKLLAERSQTPPYSDRRVTVEARLTPSEVEYTITDEGEGFDPSTLPDPTDLAFLERVHGRGLLLIRTFMDEVEHNESGNRIRLKKKLESL